MLSILNKKIEASKMKMGVLGAGYIGLPLSIEMSKRNNVVLFDTDINRINKLKNNQSYIDDVLSSALETALSQGHLLPSNEEEDLIGLDCYFICVPTPLHQKSSIPDLSYIEQAARIVANSITDGAVVILESTSYPGTTEEIVMPIFEANGLALDRDYCLSFSPERVDPGNKLYNTANTDKIVGECTELSSFLTAKVLKENLECNVYTVSSPRVAEMAKILENSYRNVNIGLINEFAIICNHMNIDIWEVIEAAKTKPFGFQPFFPGPGVGGHCIPVDPIYLSYKAKELGLETSLIDSSQKILNYMPTYIVSRIEHILTKRVHKGIKGSCLLVMGVTYKENISDYRESPAIKIIDILFQKGCKVFYYDSHIEKILVGDKELKSLSETDIYKQLFDLILITTNHSDFEYDKLLKMHTIIFDTRNALKQVSQESESIIKL